MNGVFDRQTSGNEWGSSTGSMLHERLQDRPAPERVKRQRHSFDDLERQMARHEEDHKSAVAAVCSAYVMPRDGSVQDFLNSHRVLPQLLLQAFPRLRSVFGELAVLSLRATSDEYGWQTLFVDVLWPEDATTAYAALDRFEDDWWVANCNLAAGRLNFTYRLV
jgi:hypothetical protein